MSDGGKRRRAEAGASEIAALIGVDGRLRLRVTPHAKRDRLTVERDAPGGPRLRVWVIAVPEDGKANKAVVKLLAKALGKPKSALTIERGLTSRDKTIHIAGG
ncbi:DUF167 domain-containing protein [Parasphingopyxis marina]|uniref:UPF0235 protein H6P80_02300 n=1 Tax=Parasphingopyxis marina TaxID=2761622 RepID=A0A842HY69_9SPHN|nr:DUF167 domain-containing protein [Parasphingopyxis marina]MBC2776444.1 DUF167 domain-containing protein [Parasphingopyxis marina]